MSKKNNNSADTELENPAKKLYDESVTKASDETDNLETIREILFGEQSRDAEKRRHDTHHTLTSNIVDLKKETTEQFEFLSAEINKLYSLINDESKARTIDTQGGNKVLNKLQDSLSQAKAKQETDNKQLQQQLLNESNKLEQQAAKRHEDLSLRLEQVSLELKSDKTDSGDLAKLLQGMAEQLLETNK